MKEVIHYPPTHTHTQSFSSSPFPSLPPHWQDPKIIIQRFEEFTYLPHLYCVVFWHVCLGITSRNGIISYVLGMMLSTEDKVNKINLNTALRLEGSMGAHS